MWKPMCVCMRTRSHTWARSASPMYGNWKQVLRGDGSLCNGRRRQQCLLSSWNFSSTAWSYNSRVAAYSFEMRYTQEENIYSHTWGPGLIFMLPTNADTPTKTEQNYVESAQQQLNFDTKMCLGNVLTWPEAHIGTTFPSTFVGYLYCTTKIFTEEFDCVCVSVFLNSAFFKPTSFYIDVTQQI